MTERLEYDHDDLPKMKLNLGEREFEATPFNSTLFTHLGRLAMYDHVFFQTGEEDEKVMTGTYVFRSHQVFGQIANFMSQNNYPMVLNKIEVADCDLNAFNTMIEQQMGDVEGIPEGWGDGTSET